MGQLVALPEAGQGQVSHSGWHAAAGPVFCSMARGWGADHSLLVRSDSDGLGPGPGPGAGSPRSPLT